MRKQSIRNLFYILIKCQLHVHILTDYSMNGYSPILEINNGIKLDNANNKSKNTI